MAGSHVSISTAFAPIISEICSHNYQQSGNKALLSNLRYNNAKWAVVSAIKSNCRRQFEKAGKSRKWREWQKGQINVHNCQQELYKQNCRRQKLTGARMHLPVLHRT